MGLFRSYTDTILTKSLVSWIAKLGRDIIYSWLNISPIILILITLITDFVFILIRLIIIKQIISMTPLGHNYMTAFFNLKRIVIIQDIYTSMKGVTSRNKIISSTISYRNIDTISDPKW